MKLQIKSIDPKAVELIALRLPDLASKVLRAYGGREAIDAARRKQPDVIVLDLMMPGVDGFDVIAALNEHPETARIPILVVMAKLLTDEDRARLGGSVTNIMQKAEFDPSDFRNEVRRALATREMVA